MLSRSRVEKILEEHPTETFEPQLGPPKFIILYSFKRRTNTRFYEDLEKLREKVKYNKLGSGILITDQSNDAYSLLTLMLAYGCNFEIYKTHEANPYDLLRHYWSEEANLKQ